ncbi:MULTISPECIES: site-specific integrase [Butyricimonas]|uniref:Site-specific integrase n=1 Tax=Butyricimonas hominis TaxID=2763032 RepID=A0ABR7D155_9BACT|nr:MULTISPECIES: site-specific integrase [Butyricimonas]MBC5621665.1 site-specific integrase [Butyricimonas hominis]MCB6972856.1 site-specific integrase [Butyricimonas synergistica]
MIQKLKISFYLLSSKMNIKGEAPIYCRISIGNERQQYSTGMYLIHNQWNKIKQQAKGSSPTAETINLHLNSIKSKLLDIEALFMVEKKENYTLHDIYSKFTGANQESAVTLIQVFKKKIDSMEKLIGKSYSKGTLTKFKEVFAHTLDYLIEIHNIKDIAFTHLNNDFIQGFQEYLLVNKNHKPATINKIIQRVCQIVWIGVNYDGAKYPFRNYKPLKEVKQLIYLTEEEIKLLEDFQFAQERLERVRDYYMFSVYTGLAYNEAFELKEEHIIKGFDNQLWIKMIRLKTQREINIPLLPQALKIIQKYHQAGEQGYILPTISNQKMNSYLKEIAEIVGIKKKLTHHTARKTFASTILLYNNVPIEIVSKLLGHANISITQKSYAEVVNKNVSNHMLQLSKQLESKQEHKEPL